MSTHDDGPIRRASWSELFPWLMLLRSVRIALQVRLLAIGGLGAVLMLSGWAALGLALSGDESVEREVRAYQTCPWLAVTSLVPDQPTLAVSGPHSAGETGVDSGLLARDSGLEHQRGLERGLGIAWDPLFGTWEHLSRPFQRLATPGLSMAKLAFLLLGGLWTLLVWSFAGGLITRLAAYELALRERLALGRGVEFVGKKWRSFLAAPLIPLVGVVLLAIPGLIFGLLSRWSAGAAIAGLFWPLALLAGFLLALLLIGLASAWPLLFAGVSFEGNDAYDSLGRAYNYVYQRPLHYLFYLAVVAAVGVLAWFVVANLFAAIVSLTFWTASWGGASEALAAATQPELASGGGVGSALMRFWVECLKLLGAGYLFSYFWTAISATYLLLRRHVDATELDDVFVEEEPEQLAAPLPPIATEPPAAPPAATPPAEEQE